MRKFLFYKLSASSDPENYRYIGVTVTSIKTRLAGHKYCAMHSDKRALPVHKWMWKHYQSGDTILIEQIYECDESCWEYHEARLIQEYRNAGYDLLNVDKGGRGVITKEKRNISGIQRSIAAHEKAIYAIDPKTMKVWQEFPSATKAAEYFMLKSNTSITNALSGWTKKSVGYFWVYKSDWDLGINKINTEPNFTKISNPIYRFDFDGNLIASYKSGKEFERIAEVNNCKAARDAIKSKKWYLDSFWNSEPTININDYYDVYYVLEEVDLDENIIDKYHTQHEIANKFNISDSEVCRRIKEKKPLSNGNYIKKIIKNKI